MKSNREKVFRNFKGDITNMSFISMSLKYTMNKTKNNIIININHSQEEKNNLLQQINNKVLK